MLKVLVDCSELNPANPGGVRSYTLNVTKALAQNPKADVSVLINEQSREIFQEIAKLIPSESFYVIKNANFLLKVTLAILERLGLSNIHISLKSMRVRSVLNQNSTDIVYTPTTFLNYDYGRTPSVVTIHDIQEKDFPENFSRRIRKYRDFRNRITLKYASSIHVSSSFIESTISRSYPSLYHQELFCVIPEGVEISRYKDHDCKKKRQIIFPARSWPHKNHLTLFKAMKGVGVDDMPNIIVTGAAQQDFKKIFPNPSNRIVFKGVVSEQELTDLYKESFAVISCSLYESSSLPILEGIAAGCIGIASSIPAHLEMAEHLDLELFEPTDSDELSLLIRKLTKDFERELNNRGRNNQKILRYDWMNVGDSLVMEFAKRMDIKANEH
ncbi:glycosyltransferase [Candidatus Planktophila versatilis]|uniref:Glycosyltransferase n=1 Tax=Candidatus Planktophila versatilis TaxID=1884905 RepID=A0AAC9YWE4_9ACTN|nr:glycosyltransferase [Candidatus Planktophila versatilis]ASY22054.1 glycosyltransferase [Candidatus Planktophila versatilis]